MKSILSLLALTTIALAADPFYPKAKGQGEALSVTKDTARFSMTCSKNPPVDYENSVKGGIKAIVTTPSGLTRTLNMPEAEDADFFYSRCTLIGKGTLTIDYGKGKVSKYEGTVRATVVDGTTDRHVGSPSGTLSIAFRGKDLKIPQVSFQGKVTAGHISVTHAPNNVPSQVPPGGFHDGNPPGTNGGGGVPSLL